MGDQSNYYTFYRFNDGTSYKVEIGKDGVTEVDMRHLRRISKSQDKVNAKIDKLDTVSIEATIFDDDENTALIDESANIELIIETADEYDSLHKAIGELQPQQQNLVAEIFFNGVSIADFARKYGVTEGAIRNRLRKIFSKLKNNL